MHALLATTLLALFALATSTPFIGLRQDPPESVNVSLLAARSASPIHFQAINASIGAFYIFKPTNAFCPVPAPDCAGFDNQTAVSIYPETGTAYMYANVPGGQNVYVKEDGTLSFTEPHQEDVFPNGSYTSGFTYTSEPDHGTAFLGFTNGGATTFLACPDKPTPAESYYQVFVDVVGFKDECVPSGNKSDCLTMGVLAGNVTDFGAFQYD